MNVMSHAKLSSRALIAGRQRVLSRRAARFASGCKLNDDGLYTKPWFLESLLDLTDDLKEAADKGKRFVIMWELKGCPYCKKIHEINLAKPEIENFIKDRFEVLQLNIIGSREVTDFDGERLPEKDVRAEIRRALHADLPVLSRDGRRPCAEEAGRARGRALAGLYGAEAVPGDVQVRGGPRL